MRVDLQIVICNGEAWGGRRGKIKEDGKDLHDSSIGCLQGRRGKEREWGQERGRGKGRV